MSHIINITWQV